MVYLKRELAAMYFSEALAELWRNSHCSSNYLHTCLILKHQISPRAVRVASQPGRHFNDSPKPKLVEPYTTLASILYSA